MNRNSINQNLALPDFSNSGTILRVLVIVNLLGLLAAYLRSEGWREMLSQWSNIAAVSQPLLVSSLVVFYLIEKRLRDYSYPFAVFALFAIEGLLGVIAHWLSEPIFEISLDRYWVLSLVTLGFLLWYFNLRNRALSPALAEARLQALQARIRPHFLFNSINAVLSLIRTEPSMAEKALEDLADLFRVLMADNRKLTTISREIELCREYLELEKLRLGDRLQTEWHIDKMPHDAMIPPLILQPLVENAIYHGIEPSLETGVISIHIYLRRSEIHVVIRNPYTPGKQAHREGNKMALANIRERLSLHYDVEAGMNSELMGNVFQIHITLPYIKEPERNA